MDAISTPRISETPGSRNGGIIAGAFLMLILIILIANSFLIYQHHRTDSETPSVLRLEVAE